MQIYDAIVLGVGGMGSAALYHLARRGLKVLGLEQFSVAHDRGSSHGQTRIIRKSYFEHPDYVPLLHRAYDLWADLERATGKHLFQRCGLLIAGPGDGAVIAGTKLAARTHSLVIDTLRRDELGRFPFAFDDSCEVLYEADAGFLRVEECVRTHAELAVQHGATLLTSQRARNWSANSEGLRVRTESSEFACHRLVLTSGPWIKPMLGELGVPLEVRRKVVFWYECHDQRYRVEQGCPVFGFHDGQRFIYGFPDLGDGAVKVAEHTGGQSVRDPYHVDPELLPGDEDGVRALLPRHLPGVGPQRRAFSTCMYTMTPDEHFVIDRHPLRPEVVFACGFSGHGFKFAPLIGSVLADLAIDGRTDAPIGFLSLSRPALQQA